VSLEKNEKFDAATEVLPTGLKLISYHQLFSAHFEKVSALASRLESFKARFMGVCDECDSSLEVHELVLFIWDFLASYRHPLCPQLFSQL
jgi:hypothetical protein